MKASAFLLTLAIASCSPLPLIAQTTRPPVHRTRLILKDGTYQMVMSYQVVGTRVKFISAERGGDAEEIPLAMVDLVATRKYEQAHAEGDATAQRPGAPPIDPELLKEEADRAALTPEVAENLRLPEQDTVLALDTFQGTPELVALAQSDGDLNRQTGHNILKAAINPLATSHQIVTLKGEKAAVQMHVNQPILYLRLDEAGVASGEALTVDTHGVNASEKDRPRQTAPSEYVIVRVDVRQDARVVASFNTSVTGNTKRQEDVVETDTTPLPGGHWTRIVPRQPLLIGEYCLVEVLGERSINLGVWDFGIHPTAPENRDVLRPEKRRPASLGRRRD